MAIINKIKLAKYLALDYNVLFRGLHGVGKTAIIKEVFEAAGLRWRYFSAATLDPWVDFVGVPKVIDNPNGTSELKLIRPSFIEHDEVDAIFFDEFNRGSDKVINATMELLQFKSINGHKLKNLKVIWAAVNPEDDQDTYSVNHIDPAHLDRFQVQIDVPFKVDEEYFMAKYPTIGRTFIDWWKMIPAELRYDVSPRRLDYAAHAYLNDCRLEDFLPSTSNPKKLRDLLKSLPFLEKIKQISNEADAIAFLRDINNTDTMMEMVKVKETTAIDFFDKYGSVIPKELKAPFVDVMIAVKNGQSVFDDLEELIEKLPVDKDDRGTVACAVVINNVDFNLMYQKGGSIKADMANLVKVKPTVLKKLSNRIYDMIIRTDVQTLTRQFWGIHGRDAGNPSNFQTVIELLGSVAQGGFAGFSPTQAQKINEKLYRNKIVGIMHFIP